MSPVLKPKLLFDPQAVAETLQLLIGPGQKSSGTTVSCRKEDKPGDTEKLYNPVAMGQRSMNMLPARRIGIKIEKKYAPA